MDTLTWILENMEELLTIGGAVVTVATVVTALTPTPKDDAVVSVLRAILGRAGVARFADAPGTVKLPGASAGRAQEIRDAHAKRLRVTLMERAGVDESGAPLD